MSEQLKVYSALSWLLSVAKGGWASSVVSLHGAWGGTGSPQAPPWPARVSSVLAVGRIQGERQNADGKRVQDRYQQLLGMGLPKLAVGKGSSSVPGVGGTCLPSLSDINMGRGRLRKSLVSLYTHLPFRCVCLVGVELLRRGVAQRAQSL